MQWICLKKKKEGNNIFLKSGIFVSDQVMGGVSDEMQS